MRAMAKTGRPRTRDQDEPRQYVGFAVPVALKGQLETAAQENGRSLSAEAVARLERSFKDHDAFAAAFGGPEGLKTALMLFAPFRFSGEARAGDASSWTWLRDPEAFRAGLSGTVRAAWAQQPGEPTLDDFRAWLDREFNHARSRSQSGFIEDPENIAETERDVA